jgi:hypothetical protein
MITLKVDEAYAFDYLSILEVKKNLFPSKSKIDSFEECKDFLKKQLLNFDNIYNSQEYKNLYSINKETFELVDLVRNNNQKVSAKQVDDANMERFYKKESLQKTFFSSNLVEEKIT